LHLIAFYREEEAPREAPSSLLKTELRKACISEFSLLRWAGVVIDVGKFAAHTTREGA
jgi:hypothetical protein